MIDRLTGGDKQKAKLIAVSAVLAICLIWLAFNLIPMLVPAPRAKEPDTTGWRLVKKLNEGLSSDPAFTDATFTVESESPLKLQVVGAVHSQGDVAKLEEAAKKLVAESGTPAEVSFNVEVLGH